MKELWDRAAELQAQRDLEIIEAGYCINIWVDVLYGDQPMMVDFPVDRDPRVGDIRYFDFEGLQPYVVLEFDIYWDEDDRPPYSRAMGFARFAVYGEDPPPRIQRSSRRRRRF